jgi:hypothetical protein
MVLAALQLQAVGKQDSYLTQNPQINVFKYQYYKYLNFANDIYRFSFNDTPRFGGKYNVQIPKRGHLLTKLYIRVSLPILEKINLNYASWADPLAFSIFEGPIEFLVNGVIIDRLYPVCMDIVDELESSPYNKGHNNMILKGDTYVSSMHNAEKEVDLIIPLSFWFTKHSSLALPIASMFNEDIQINFQFRQFDNVINYDGLKPLEKKIKEADIIAEYITLDSSIADHFLAKSHTYIITQSIYNGDEVINRNKALHQTKITFKSICKELLFSFVETNSINTNNYFNYSRTNDENSFVKEINLSFDGRNRYSEFLPESVYRYIMPKSYHSTVPSKYFYTIPFAVKPEDYLQPSGGVNVGRLDEVLLSFKLKEDNEECHLYVFGICYQILTVKNGKLSVGFLN